MTETHRTEDERCNGSGTIVVASGGSGWGSGGPEATIERVECPGCPACDPAWGDTSAPFPDDMKEWP